MLPDCSGPSQVTLAGQLKALAANLEDTVSTDLSGSEPASSDLIVVRSALNFPVVGIGASAGGLAATTRLLEAMPASSGMAFVVVLHLSPQHESHAAPILQRATRMPVLQVTEPVAIEADHVYVIAPALQLTMQDGHLQVQAMQRPRGRQIAIDLFFRTLALAHGERSIAIVLSGAGSDGSVGLAELKSEGGVVFAQSPADAEYEAMPSAAIATRLVDFVLPVTEIAGKLVDLWHNARRIQLPGAKAIGSKAAEPHGPKAVANAEAAIRDVLVLLQARTTNDFRHYKRATVLRRLERRMQVTGQPHLPAYCDYLERHPEETEPLLQDMLISVTSFFRDRAAFESLERELMARLGGRHNPNQLRAWVAGCATGEEAYSLAMLINDHLPAQPPMSVQIFASDIDERALATARHGVYPQAIVTDVPPTRLRQYMQEENGTYRVKKALREQVMFAHHNVLRDPPFSRVDLICCRNLLIYLEREIQEQVLEVFHFSLNPGGLLLLGSADSADWMPRLFTPIDKRQRLYRAEVAPRRRDLPTLRLETPPLKRPSQRLVSGRPVATLAQVHERLVLEELPPSILIDGRRTVMHVNGGASRYLLPHEGSPATDVLEMVLPELAGALRPALLHAMHANCRVATGPAKVARDEGEHVVLLSVRPAAREGQRGTFIVLFDEVDVSLAGETAPGAADPTRGILEEELRRLQMQLQGSIGDSATSSEALCASNEELQSINEELRAATEELETSKEELQSVNEELTTVNFELKRKVEEAAKVNDDLSNLIVSMDIATVFIDRAMRIKRFTPRAAGVFNVLATDLGRPLMDLTHRLNYPELEVEVASVLDSLQTLEREVEGRDGGWFLVRISPYRRGEDRVDGAVLNIIDVSERRKAQEQLRAREERLRLVAEGTRDYAIMTLDADGRVTSWNTGAELMFGYGEAEMLGRPFDDIFTPEDRAARVPQTELRHAIENGRALDERWHQRKDGSRFYCSGITAPFMDRSHHGFAKIARDLTQRQLLEHQRDALLQAEKNVRHQLEAAQALRSEFLAIMSHELKNPLNLILMNVELLGRSESVRASPALSRAAEAIRRTVHGQSQIIDDLLDLSRLNTGKLSLHRTSVDARQVVEGIAAAVAEEARSGQLTLDVEAESVVVHADAVRLEQVVWNLLRNALKFTPAGGAIRVALHREGAYARLQVEDNGRGIDADHIEQIFDMFSQVDRRAATRREGGLGIGLALVRELVELHGGRVEARSAGPGQGATFTVWLPVAEGLFGEQQSRRVPAWEGVRILLVDDNADAVESFATLLELEGAKVITASSARQALDKAETGDFDLVVSDIAMPDMDGRELVAELRRRERSAHWPAIAVTGFGRPWDIDAARAAGFDQHLSKPVSLDALVAAYTGIRSRHG
jgi:two-component system CheB/CheR fusion protein